MKLKRITLITLAAVILLALGTGAYFITRPGQDHGQSAAKDETLYTCGMHPQVIQKKPGNCPICGMKLTPIRKPAGGATDVTTVRGGLAPKSNRCCWTTQNIGNHPLAKFRSLV